MNKKFEGVRPPVVETTRQQRDPDARPASPWDQARPRAAPRDKRERQAARDVREPVSARDTRAPVPARDDRDSGVQLPSESAEPRAAKRRDVELRVFGVNACLAVFARRPQAIRKVYLRQDRTPRMSALLAWCAKNKIGYRYVENLDLEKLTQSQHHEGVCLEVLRDAPVSLTDFLLHEPDRDQPSLLVLLDGVGNPHNLGAVLRSGAHFGIAGVVLPAGSDLALSGAACRVAEGGAESVPLIALGDPLAALKSLSRCGYKLAATVVHSGASLYAQPLPRRLLLVFGAEQSGVSSAWLNLVQQRISIPGTGAVESLNIASAVGVVAAEHWRLYRAQ